MGFGTLTHSFTLGVSFFCFKLFLYFAFRFSNWIGSFDSDIDNNISADLLKDRGFDVLQYGLCPSLV